jgi:hypothetical protein
VQGAAGIQAPRDSSVEFDGATDCRQESKKLWYGEEKQIETDRLIEVLTRPTKERASVRVDLRRAFESKSTGEWVARTYLLHVVRRIWHIGSASLAAET